ncbi:hypothetical protein ACVMB1_000242 [Bradyrhizobium sp. USDA 4504]
MSFAEKTHMTTDATITPELLDYCLQRSLKTPAGADAIFKRLIRL